MMKLKPVILFMFVTLLTNGQLSNLQPFPKNIVVEDQIVDLLNNGKLYISAHNIAEQKAAAYLEYLIKDEFDCGSVISESGNENSFWHILFSELPPGNQYPNEQFYMIGFDTSANTVNISSPSMLGLLYGAVTFSDMIIRKDDQLTAELFSVKDYPDYKGRMFVANPAAEDIPSLFDFALRNKFETVVLASRQHPWFKITDGYLSILKEIKKWKDKFGGPKVMQSHNIYEEKQIVISNEDDINALKNVIETSYKYGIEKLMILSDDTPPYKFGEGYILTDRNDKKKFDHFEAANTYLMNELNDWFEKNNYKIEPYYVPAFYTYEDMHQGDMELFVGTPWEKEAFGPLYWDLEYLGKHMNENTFIVWTGPYVRSRKITEESVVDWTGNLSGRVPFLWDNTIYSHHPFTSTPLLTAWNNNLPDNFNEITAGNGMFVNGDINSENTVVSAITTNDYLWNSHSYNPGKSLHTAVEREYGKELVEPVLQFKETELNFRKLIGQRKLWFQADTLWQQIRKVRFITDKNPFYYHLNYTRMKALRLQLKASVPEPVSKEKFMEKCRTADNERKQILNSIKFVNPDVYNRLKSLVTPLPDFNKIK